MINFAEGYEPAEKVVKKKESKSGFLEVIKTNLVETDTNLIATILVKSEGVNLKNFTEHFFDTSEGMVVAEKLIDKKWLGPKGDSLVDLHYTVSCNDKEGGMKEFVLRYYLTGSE